MHKIPNMQESHMEAVHAVNNNYNMIKYKNNTFLCKHISTGQIYVYIWYKNGLAIFPVQWSFAYVLAVNATFLPFLQILQV